MLILIIIKMKIEEILFVIAVLLIGFSFGFCASRYIQRRTTSEKSAITGQENPMTNLKETIEAKQTAVIED